MIRLASLTVDGLLAKPEKVAIEVVQFDAGSYVKTAEDASLLDRLAPGTSAGLTLPPTAVL